MHIEHTEPARSLRAPANELSALDASAPSLSYRTRVHGMTACVAIRVHSCTFLPMSAGSADRSWGRVPWSAPRAPTVLRATVRPRVLVDSVLVIATATLVASPSLFTNRPFALDYGNSFWLSWVEGQSVAHALTPSYFLHTTARDGIFNPLFAFYGGPAWTTFGASGAILGGHYGLAFGGVIAVAVAAAYGGALWLARQCGVGGLLAHLPALVFPTSAYYVTNLYGRGDLAEFMATSAIPLLIASATYLLRAPRWTPLPVLAFLCSLVVFTGSHNITLLCGSVVVALACAVLAAIIRPRLPGARRIAAFAGLTCLGTAVNAWYLVPNLLYEARTNIAVVLGDSGYGAPYFSTFQILFNPLRSVPSASSTPALYVQLPVWFLLWACCASALIWTHGAHRRLKGAWLSLIAMLVVLLVVILSSSAWMALPGVLRYLQFPYRLVTYVTLVATALVTISCIRLAKSKGGLALAFRISGMAVALISLGLCVWQLWVPKAENAPPPAYYATKGEALVSVNTLPPKSWYEQMAYADNSAPLRAVQAGRSVTIDPSLVHNDRYSGWLNFPPGPSPVLTNIAGGPYLVDIKGVRRVGRSAIGFAVVERTKPGSGPVHVVVEEAASLPLEFAWWSSAVAVLGSLLLVAVLAIRRGPRRPLPRRKSS
jgi:hypothetical protein